MYLKMQTLSFFIGNELHLLMDNVFFFHGIMLLQTSFFELKTLFLILFFSVAHNIIRRSPSVDSLDFDRSSLISSDTLPLLTDRQNFGKIESWTDLLWPQPHYIRIDTNERIMKFPSDNRLKIYFDGCGDGEPRRIMQVVQTFLSYLRSIHLEIEYRGHKVPDSPLDGRVMCGIFEDGERQGSYTLDIAKDGIQLMANDYAGIHHGFATLVQILRIFKISDGKRKISQASTFSSSHNTSNGSGFGLSNSYSDGFPPIPLENESFSVIPCLTIRDYPDLTIRAVYQDFSGCKMLNVDTVSRILNY